MGSRDKSTRHQYRFLLLALALVFPQVAMADVFKCRNVKGQIAFMDRPCPAGSQVEPLYLRTERNGASADGINIDCIVLARTIWPLQPGEASGLLDPAQLAELGRARDNLASTCKVRLTASPLVYTCAGKQRELTAATAKAADPKFEKARNERQSDFDHVCGEAAIDEDIRTHLRAVNVPAPPPQ